MARARRFAQALDRPAAPPPGLRLYLVAGDAVPTSSRLEVAAESGAIRVTEEAPGDGKVLRSSALMDERLDGEWASRLRSPEAWHEVLLLFRDHLGLTMDPTFTNNLLFWLLEEPRAGEPSAGRGGGAAWQDSRIRRPGAVWRPGAHEEVAQ